VVEEPELPGLEEFRAYVAQRGLIVRRTYEWPSEEDEVGYWQIYLTKEELRFNGKLYMHMIEVRDTDVLPKWEEKWGVLCELVEAGFKRTLEENRASDEDERIHRITEMLTEPDWQLGWVTNDFYFLLAVVDRLKDKERSLEEELKWNWRESSTLRHALDKVMDAQPAALRMIRENGFVFDDIGREPGNWKHLAFSLYTDICELSTLAHHALGIPLGEDSSEENGRIQ
jgi:hypothetical protein